MDRIRICGGARLEGAIPISGAKNAALPLMATCLLTHEPLVLANTPELADIAFMAELLRSFGVETSHVDGTLSLSAARVKHTTAAYDLGARCARASWCSDRCSRACARPVFRCQAAAPSARARSTCISPRIARAGRRDRIARRLCRRERPGRVAARRSIFRRCLSVPTRARDDGRGARAPAKA